MKENKTLQIFLTCVFVLATDRRSRYTKPTKEKIENAYLLSYRVFFYMVIKYIRKAANDR